MKRTELDSHSPRGRRGRSCVGALILAAAALLAWCNWHGYVVRSRPAPHIAFIAVRSFYTNRHSAGALNFWTRILPEGFQYDRLDLMAADAKGDKTWLIQQMELTTFPGAQSQLLKLLPLDSGVYPLRYGFVDDGALAVSVRERPGSDMLKTRLIDLRTGASAKLPSALSEWSMADPIWSAGAGTPPYLGWINSTSDLVQWDGAEKRWGDAGFPALKAAFGYGQGQLPLVWGDTVLVSHEWSPPSHPTELGRKLSLFDLKSKQLVREFAQFNKDGLNGTELALFPPDGKAAAAAGYRLSTMPVYGKQSSVKPEFWRVETWGVIPPVGGGPAIVSLGCEWPPVAFKQSKSLKRLMFMNPDTGETRPISISVIGKPPNWLAMKRLRLTWYAVTKDRKGIFLSVLAVRPLQSALLYSNSTAGPWKLIHEQQLMINPHPVLTGDGSLWFARTFQQPQAAGAAKPKYAVELVRYDPATGAKKVVFSSIGIGMLVTDVPGGGGVEFYFMASAS